MSQVVLDFNNGEKSRENRKRIMDLPFIKGLVDDRKISFGLRRLTLKTKKKDSSPCADCMTGVLLNMEGVRDVRIVPDKYL